MYEAARDRDLRRRPDKRAESCIGSIFRCCWIRNFVFDQVLRYPYGDTATIWLLYGLGEAIEEESGDGHFVVQLNRAPGDVRYDRVDVAGEAWIDVRILGHQRLCEQQSTRNGKCKDVVW